MLHNGAKSQQAFSYNLLQISMILGSFANMEVPSSSQIIWPNSKNRSGNGPLKVPSVRTSNSIVSVVIFEPCLNGDVLAAKQDRSSRRRGISNTHRNVKFQEIRHELSQIS